VEPKVWQYAFYHKHDVELMREYLMIEPAHGFLQLLGASFDSKLVTVDDETEDRQGI